MVRSFCTFIGVCCANTQSPLPQKCNGLSVIFGYTLEWVMMFVHLSSHFDCFSQDMCRSVTAREWGTSCARFYFWCFSFEYTDPLEISVGKVNYLLSVGFFHAFSVLTSRSEVELRVESFLFLIESIQWLFSSQVNDFTRVESMSSGVVAPSRKLFTNWTKVSLRTTHDWRIKFKRANEKHSSEQVLHFPWLHPSQVNESS